MLESAFDPKHPYYDEKSTRDNPKWDLVHVKFIRKFDDLIRLTELKSFAKPGGALEKLQVLKQARLSVSKVTPKEWRFIMSLTKEDSDPEQEKATEVLNGVAQEALDANQDGDATAETSGHVADVES